MIARSGSADGVDESRKRMIYWGSAVLVCLLLVGSWSFVLYEQSHSNVTLLSWDNWQQLRGFGERLLGLNQETPAYLSASKWSGALRLSLKTLQMSILGIGFAGVGMIVTILFGARVTHDGSLSMREHGLGWLFYYFIRLTYILTRAVPELFWAMFVILVFEPGILPGAVALGLHNYGILGKLCSEVVEDLDLRPVKALRGSGAGIFQILVYGVLPSVTPMFLTYVFYRWEAIIRATIVVGFVSAGGLGQKFRLSMSWFHYSDVTLLLICYFFLVVIVDVISGLMRALAKR